MDHHQKVGDLKAARRRPGKIDFAWAAALREWRFLGRYSAASVAQRKQVSG